MSDAKAAKGLDLFELLAAISKGDANYYKRLPDYQKKGFSPFLTYQWLLGNGVGDHTLLLNLANPYIFKLNKHPELLYMLLVACSQFASGRFTWTQYAKARPSYDFLNTVVARSFDCSMREAQMILPDLTDSDIIIFANELGLQTDEMKQLNEQLTKRKKQ